METNNFDAIHILEELIKIDSQNPGAQETEIAGVIEEILKQARVIYHIRKSGKDRVNLIGQINPHGSEILLFNGHMDTKPAGLHWQNDPLRPKKVGNRLIGLGASDMKGGIAALLSAVLRYQESKQSINLERQIMLQFVADEEMNSIYGTKFLISNNDVPPARCAIVMEPSDMKVITRSLGNHWLAITFTGRKAHAGHYWQGINAIELAQEFVKQLAIKLSAFNYFDDPNYSMFPHSNIGFIEGGSHPGSVPDRCVLHVGIRFRSEPERGQYLKIVKEICNSICGNALIEDYAGGGLPPFDFSQHRGSTEFFNLLEASYRTCSLGKPSYGCFFGASDAGLLSSWCNIPTIVLGPGSLDQAHCPNEETSISQIRDAANLYRRIIEKWLAKI